MPELLHNPTKYVIVPERSRQLALDSVLAPDLQESPCFGVAPKPSRSAILSHVESRCCTTGLAKPDQDPAPEQRDKRIFSAQDRPYGLLLLLLEPAPIAQQLRDICKRSLVSRIRHRSFRHFRIFRCYYHGNCILMSPNFRGAQNKTAMES